MGLDYIPHQGRSFLGVTKLFVTSGARSNKQTNKQDPFFDDFVQPSYKVSKIPSKMFNGIYIQ